MKINLEGKLKLHEIEVEGFKIFNTPERISLDSKIVLFLGPIGTGKTSILEAIGYAIYGTTRDVLERRIKTDDLINDFRDTLKVTLTLKDDNGNILKIVRYRTRSKKTSKLKVYLNSKPLNIMEKELEKLLGLNFDDFSRQIYVKGDLLREIVSGTPVKRSLALDKLLGIDFLEDFYNSLSPRRIRLQIEELSSKISFYEVDLDESIEEIEQKLKELEEERNHLLQKAKELEENLNTLKQLWEEMSNKKRIYSELLKRKETLELLLNKLKSPDIEKYSIISLEVELESLKPKLKPLLTSLLYEEKINLVDKISINNPSESLKIFSEIRNILAKSIESLEEELLTIKDEISKYKSSKYTLHEKYLELREKINELKLYEEKYKTLLVKYGSSIDITKKIREIKEKLKEIDKEISNVSARRTLIKNLIEQLRKNRKTKCPVCGKELLYEQDLKHLIDELGKISKKEIKNILKEKDKLEKTLQNLEDIKIKLDQLEKKIYDLKIFKSEFENIQVELERLDNLIMEGEEQEHNLESKIENIQEMLSRIEKILKILEVIAKRQEIGNIVTELESIKRQLKNFEDLPEKISIVDKKIRENEIERIKVKHELQFIENEVSRLKSRLQKVKKIRENKKEYLEKIEKLKELYNTITAIRKAIREIQTKIRKESLVKIRDEMNNVFRKIYVHPDYDALNIKIITPPGEQSKSIYEIYARRSIDKAWIPVHVKLSDGQKSVIAYSLLGAFFQVAKHRIGFMIIDEPLLNVDEECKKAWMEAMISLRQLGQLIIASQDRSLLEIRKLYPQTIAYMFSHGGIEGPKIRRL